MRKIRRAFIALICLLLAVTVLFFTLENKQQVELGFLGYSSPSMPLAVAVLAGFVAGAFFAGLTFWLPLGHYKRKVAKQAKQLVLLQEQLAQAKEQQKTQASEPKSQATGVVVADTAA